MSAVQITTFSLPNVYSNSLPIVYFKLELKVKMQKTKSEKLYQDKLCEAVVDASANSSSHPGCKHDDYLGQKNERD